MARRVNGILFDLGDTLIDFGRVDIPTMFERGARGAYDFLQELGLDLPPFARYHRSQLWAIRWNYFKSHFTRREFNTLDLLGQLGQRMGHDLTAEQTLELAWRWYEPLSQCGKVEPGLPEMLRRFSQQGLVLGLVSNTFVPGVVLDRHLEREGLLEFLPVRVYSCEVGYRKPHPQIFRIALQRSGLSAGQTLFVGDSPAADIRGSQREGMIAVLKETPRHPTAAADYCLARITELADVVDHINSRPEQS